MQKLVYDQIEIELPCVGKRSIRINGAELRTVTGIEIKVVEYGKPHLVTITLEAEVNHGPEGALPDAQTSVE